MHNLWILKGQEWLNITPLISKLTWSSQLGTLGDQLKFDILASDTKYVPKIDIDAGAIVSLHNDKKQLYKGEVFTVSYSGEHLRSYDTFDFAFFLNKSKDIYQFNKASANAAIERMLKDYEVEIGEIVPIPLVVDKIYANKPISGIIRDILLLAEEQLGKKYLLEMYDGKFCIKETPKEPLKLTFQLASNLPHHELTSFIQNPSRSRSITNMKNSIKILSGQDIVATEKQETHIHQFGLLQEVRTVSKEEKSKAKKLAEQLLSDLSKITEESSLTLPGHDEVRAGRSLEIEEEMTGMKGVYRVKNCTHAIDNGHHTMNLSLEKWNNG